MRSIAAARKPIQISIMLMKGALLLFCAIGAGAQSNGDPACPCITEVRLLRALSLTPF